MGNTIRFSGVNFDNLRKALYLMFFGAGEVKDKQGKVIKYLCDDFDSELDSLSFSVFSIDVISTTPVSTS